MNIILKKPRGIMEPVGDGGLPFLHLAHAVKDIGWGNITIFFTVAVPKQTDLLCGEEEKALHFQFNFC